MLGVIDDALNVLGQVLELVLPALELADLGLALRQALDGVGDIGAHALGIVVQAREGVAVDALLAQLRDILLQLGLQPLHLVLARLDTFERGRPGKRLGKDAAHLGLRAIELFLPAAQGAQLMLALADDLEGAAEFALGALRLLAQTLDLAGLDLMGQHGRQALAQIIEVGLHLALARFQSRDVAVGFQNELNFAA